MMMDCPWLSVPAVRHGRISHVLSMTSKAKRISYAYGVGIGEGTARGSIPSSLGFPAYDGNVYNSLVLSHFRNSCRVYSHCLE